MISSGNGKLALFNQVFWTKLLPVAIDPDKTRSQSQDGKADTQILHINARYVVLYRFSGLFHKDRLWNQPMMGSSACWAAMLA